MAEQWRFTEAHGKYMDDPVFLEERFGARPLRQLLSTPGVVGASRLTVKPSFSGESIYTFAYGPQDVTVEVRRAAQSLWYSLSGGEWVAPVRSEYTLPLQSLTAPINGWASLKEAARAAPSVSIAIIDGKQYSTLDGIGYRHRVVDIDTDVDAEWNNPDEEASNHVSQVRLVKAYERVFLLCGGAPY